MTRAYRNWLTGVSVIALVAVPGIGMSDIVDRTLNLYGRPGLIDTPSATVMDDGDVAVSITTFPGQTRTTLSFQISERLTGSFRYSKINDFYGAGDALYDRSFDLSYQILTETANRPAVSIGLQDFIGTGFYSAEYIVASKSFGDDLRVTGGVGWGRLGGIGALGAPFGERPPLDFGEGGRLSTDQWFRGDAALFGGIEYAVNDRLTFTAEYSSDDYRREEGRDLFERDSPFNFGVSYQFKHGGVLSGYYLYGSEIGVGYSYVLNPKRPIATTGFEAAPVPLSPRPSRAADPEAYEADWVTNASEIAGGKDSIARALAKEGQVLEAISLDATRAKVTIRNTRFGAHPQAIGRTARVLSRGLPASIEVFEITVATSTGIPSTTTIIRRSDLERLEFEGSDAILPRVAFADSVGRASDQSYSAPRDKFTWALEPGLAVSLFDPEAPVRGDLTLQLRGKYEIARGLIAQGSISATLAGTLDEIDELGESALPRVRSDIGLYQGNPRLSSATLAWYARPGSNLYSRVTGGYLETQFGGVSGEVLWMPVNSRLALGAEVNYARKRDFDGGLGFLDYDVITGHASAYYDFGGGYLGQLDVGRYLAGDVGATVSFSREFDNGWVIGAYATQTDVTFEDFGEGSFDKGIRLTVPVEWASGQPSRNRTSVSLRSLSRDGGARLSVPGRLYETVRETRQDELSDRWGRFWR